MRRFQNYIKDVIAEMKKVTWPSKDELYGATIAVLAFSFISGVFVFGVDNALTWMMKTTIEYFGK